MRDGRCAFRLGLTGSGVLGLALLVGSCGDGVTGLEDVNGEITVTEPVRATIQTLPLASDGNEFVARAGGSSFEVGLSYISFPPGTIPIGDSVEIRNQGTGGTTGGLVVDGGLDPVSIPAEAGDELQITVLAFGDPKPVTRLFRVVPEENPPVVVRTDPRRRRTKVPLNKTVDLIFSEPIALSSLDSESVRLLNGEDPVPVEILSSSEGILIQLRPLAPLEPATTYTISVAPEVRDLAGSLLSSPFESEFTTTDEVGAIQVITATSQPELEDDGWYRIVLDGLEGPTIRVQDTLVWESVGVGLHKVSLSGIGPSCHLTSNTPGDVLVRAGETETLVYEVMCHAGSVKMGIVVSGGPVDPDAEVTWTFNDEYSWTVPLSSFLDHPPGYYAYYGPGGEWKVELTLPKNCVAEDNPRTVLVTAATWVIFEVQCFQGFLEVTTATSGTSTDPDGYQLVIDGDEVFPFSANEQRTLYGVQPGDRVLELTGIDSHCVLSGDNPRTVTVHALEEGGSVKFELVCSAGGAPGEK